MSRTSRTKKRPPKPTKKTGVQAITRMGKWKGVFLGVLAETGNVSAAIRGAGIARETVYAAKQKDPSFAQAWGEALDAAVDLLKAEARRRAVEGVDIPVTHEGELAFVAVGPDGQYVPKELAYERDEVAKQSYLKNGFKLVPFMKKQYSDGMLALLLKSGRPSEFGDKMQISKGKEEDAPEEIILVHSAPPPAPPAAGAK
jgi:hypothetical protein